MSPKVAASIPLGNPSVAYYVIIGCGFAGILNHVLLRHPTSTRLGSLPVLQIGSEDPWRNYHPMPMGQWPSLLTLPGFRHQPPSLGGRGNLASDQFADVNDKEWNDLSAAHPFYHVDARVVAIRAGTTASYEIDLDNGRVFQAEYIDVCGGPGPARTPTMSVDPALIRYRQKRTGQRNRRPLRASD